MPEVTFKEVAGCILVHIFNILPVACHIIYKAPITYTCKLREMYFNIMEIVNIEMVFSVHRWQ